MPSLAACASPPAYAPASAAAADAAEDVAVLKPAPQTRPSNPSLDAARLHRIEGPPGASCHAPPVACPCHHAPKSAPQSRAVPSRPRSTRIHVRANQIKGQDPIRPSVTRRPITPLNEPHVASLSQNAPFTSLINPRRVSSRSRPQARSWSSTHHVPQSPPLPITSLNQAHIVKHPPTSQALTVKCTSRPQSSRPQSSHHVLNRFITSPIESPRPSSGRDPCRASSHVSAELRHRRPIKLSDLDLTRI